MPRVLGLVVLLLLMHGVWSEDPHLCAICEAGTFCFNEGAYTCPQHSTSPAGSTSADACVCHAGYYMSSGECLICLENSYCEGDNTIKSCPQHTVSEAFSSAVEQCVCDVGYYKNGAACVACEVGTFKNTVGNQACLDCAVDTYQDTTAATGCKACPSNTVSPAKSSVLSACVSNVGYHAATPGVLATACHAGTYQDELGQTACKECADVGNTWSDTVAATTADTCEACPVHTVANHPSLYSAVEQTNCHCVAGYTGPDGGPCAPCAVGTFKAQTGAAECAACPANTYNPSQASTEASACLPCPADSQAAPASSAISQCVCVEGFERHSDTCVACPPGEVSGFGGVCAPCPADFFQLNASHCEACPPHTTSEAGSPSSSLCVCVEGYEYDAAWRGCVPCTVGQFNGAINSTCEPCAVGTYSNLAGMSACTDCTPFSTTLAGGAATASACLCNAGYEAAGGACEACSPGFYSSQDSTCAPCPEDTYAVDAASTACTDCHANSEAPEASLSAAACICSAGHYLLGVVCESCEAGKAKGAAGNAACPLCEAGSFSAGTGATACVSCPENTYAPDLGTSVCSGCPDFSVSPEGSSAVDQCLCLPGFYRDGDACVACAHGSYKTTTANEACQACGVGYYTSSTGETAPEACLLSPADHYVQAGQSLACHDNSQSAPGSVGLASCLCNSGFTKTDSACTACATGTYKEAVGDQACTPCSPGYGLASPPTVPSITHTDACAQCPENTFSSGAGASLRCEACPANSQSPAESSVVTACECMVGYTGPDGGSCAACAAGKYKDVVGDAACALCGNSTYNPDTAAVSVASCRACPKNSSTASSLAPFTAETQCICRDGFERVGASPAACVLCGAGSWGNSQSCYPCPADTYYPFARPPFSQHRCTPCPGNSSSSEGAFTLAACVCDDGFVRGENASPLCALCPAGSYCPAEDTVVPCRNNSHSPPGAFEAVHCLCDAGFAGAECARCAVDSYCPGGLEALQLPCAANASSVAGSSRCTCDPGFYLRVEEPHLIGDGEIDAAGELCTVCPPDTFCYVGELLSCPDNSSSVRRSDDILDCQCHPGFERVGDACSECPDTRLCVGGNGPATECAGGATVHGHERCVCEPGKHCEGEASCTHAHRCRPCAADHFCHGNVEHPCPPHMSSPANSTSTAACFCADGAYRVQDSCLPCPAGSYCYGGDRYLCSDLDPRIRTLGPGAVHAHECLCELGWFRLATDDRCKPCPPNFFCPPEQAFELPNVVQCMEHATSPERSHAREQCTCPAGYRLTQNSEIMKCIKCADGERCEDGEVTFCVGDHRVASLDHTSCVCDAGYAEINFECVACAPGFIKAEVGNELCQPCPQNFFWVNATMCAPCPEHASSKPGSLVCGCEAPRVLASGSSPAQPVCLLCEANEYYEAEACVQCPLNSTSPVGSPAIASCQCDSGFRRHASSNGTQCIACAAGKYEAAGVCTACPAGALSPAASSSLSACACNLTLCQQQVWGAADECSGVCAEVSPPCEACEPGTFKASLDTSEQCALCAVSKFQPAAGATACVQCAANSAHLLVGQTNASSCKCDPGFFREGGVCTACALGTAKRLSGDEACTVCPVGTFADARAMTACTSCTLATMYDVFGRASNSTTDVGAVHVDNCTCAPGAYLRVLNASSACEPCHPGSYKVLAGDHECHFCGALSAVTGTAFENHYGSASPGATLSSTCQPCPPFSGQDPELVGYDLALTSPSSCLCFNGHTGWTPDGCSLCAPFTFKLGYSNEPCQFCADGHFFVDNFHACEPCELQDAAGLDHNLFATNRNDPDLRWGVDEADCMCRLGYIRTPDTVPACSPCSKGTFRNDRTLNTCEPCEANTFANETAQLHCHACPANSSTLGTTGSTSISACICDVGMQFDESQRACVLCEAGKFRNELSMSTCAECAADTFSEEGAVVCTDCGANEYSPPGSPDESRCACRAGFGGAPASGAFDRCRPCPPASFSGGGIASFNVQLRRPECESCPSGKNSSVSSTVVEDCKCYAGHGISRHAAATDACVPCDSGFFSKGGENKPCLSCGFGTVSDLGSDSLDDCECNAEIGLYET